MGPVAERALRRMCAAILHRGPDDEGHYVDAIVALGMRRLSVIDLATGHQPIANEDGSVVVVLNGEIYNYRELRRSLQSRGHRFATDSDTETLVHLYEEQGDDFVRDLRGMFALALWDRRRKRLLLVRDRFGIKPLYYADTTDGLIFCSELRSLVALEGTPHVLDKEAVGEYLTFGYVPDPRSIFRGVHKLAPGHALAWTPERGVAVSQYWSPASVKATPIDARDAALELDRLLRESVRLHLESDVPFGAFLSGGLDSSTVVSLMSTMVDRPVQTFSIGFDEPEFNEAPAAAQVARAFGTDHTELIVRPNAEVLIEDIARAYDEPFGDPSALPTFLVSQLARQRVTVALSGDGGDELFAGYTRYVSAQRKWRIAPDRARFGLRRAVRRLPLGWLGRNWLLDLTRTRRGQYASTVAMPLSVTEGGIGSRSVADAGKDTDSVLERWFDQVAHRDPLTQMTLVDVSSYLPGDILTKVDRASMAFSLEARVPLLDHKLAEFAFSLPADLKLRENQSKWVFRQTIRNLVPQSVLARPKQGFALPLVRWFRNELRHRLTEPGDPRSPTADFIDRHAYGRLVAEHLSGRRDHSILLWRTLVLHLWLRSLECGDLARPFVPSQSLDTIVREASRSLVAQ